MRLARLWLGGLLLIACGCPAPKGTQRPYPEPTVADLVAQLSKARDAMTSFRADSTMDYWMGNQRAKGEVLVMGATGAKVRFAALSPAGGSSMAEMACDGTNFVYVDYQNNCALTGPCDQRSIATFFHIELAPDDFLHLAVGTPPIVGATGKLTYVGGVRSSSSPAPTAPRSSRSTSRAESSTSSRPSSSAPTARRGGR